MKFTQIYLHLNSQGKVNTVTDETNVMKGLHSWVLLLMFELNKKLTCLWSLCQQINTLFLCSLSFLPGSLTLQRFKALCFFPAMLQWTHCSHVFSYCLRSDYLQFSFNTRMFLTVAKLSLYLNIITLLRNMKHSLQRVSCLSGSTVSSFVCAFVDLKCLITDLNSFFPLY